MKVNELPTPFYIVYENRLERNLKIIDDVSRRAGVKIIMAFKANALWRTFDIIARHCRSFTASSLNELRLGLEHLGTDAHCYCPAYTDTTIGEYLAGSTHLTFNSLSQWDRFSAKVAEYNATHNDRRVSPGLRVNPKCSVIDTDIYNPALPGSRFGVCAKELKALPDGIEGLHFHALCESSSHDLEKVLDAFENQFGHLIDKLRWVNMGGGHLMTREGYDIEHLIMLLKSFKDRHPGIEVILEPGSAFTWRTGDLITSVVDTIENDGVKTAIVDVSFSCHMPDTLEMPYKPTITESVGVDPTLPTYRLGGNSCLSGDFMGDWSFAEPLKAGDRLTLEDMNHYTTVKTTMFNGISHPAIAIVSSEDADDCRVLRSFGYEDYKSRMC